MNKKLIRVAGGKIPADLAVINGKIVNVYTKEIYDGGVAICDDKIAAVGDVSYAIGENTKVIDAKGAYITPGFIDGHIHPESTSLSIRSFAEIMLKHGTTVVMTDLHEVGVVGGLEAIEAVLDEAKDTDLKLYFVVPSHVPFSPNLETSGGLFDAKIIRKALERDDAVGLSECVGTYIGLEYEELLESIDDTLKRGKSVQGHMPETSGPSLNACLAAGISTDHESFSGEHVIDRLRNGCHAMIRESSVARSLKDCLQYVIDANINLDRASVVTDDLHTIDAVDRGHLDDTVRTMLSMGVDFASAIKMVSLNAARAFSLDNEVGGLAPGKRADINITTGPVDFKVKSVISGGKLVTEEEVFLAPYPKAKHDPILLNTAKLKNPITAESFYYKVDPKAKSVNVHVIETLPFIPIGQKREAILKVKDGIVQCDPSQDVLYVSQVERYGKNGNVGLAFMGGFHLGRGAIASSVGHDNHNVIVLGTNHEDMAVAVNRVIELGGGQVIVDGGKVTSEIGYPVLGLLSDLSAEEVSAKKKELIAITHEMGSIIPLPFMFLSFLCLAAMGGFVITDHGFIDAINQKVANPILDTFYE